MFPLALLFLSNEGKDSDGKYVLRISATNSTETVV